MESLPTSNSKAENFKVYVRKNILDYGVAKIKTQQEIQVLMHGVHGCSTHASSLTVQQGVVGGGAQ